jgi:hypothetical protein
VEIIVVEVAVAATEVNGTIFFLLFTTFIIEGAKNSENN